MVDNHAERKNAPLPGILGSVVVPTYAPMLATSGVGRVDAGWAAEPKLDGWRAIVTVGDRLEVRSRTGRYITSLVPELEPLAQLGHQMVLDGELVALDDHGRVDFWSLSQRMVTKRLTRHVMFCIFDVLWLEGMDCTRLPYVARRKVLDMLELTGPTWCTLPSFAAEDAQALLDACGHWGQEGIVLKKLDAPYLPGVRSKAWRKAKTTEWRTSEAPRRLPAEVRARMEARE